MIWRGVRVSLVTSRILPTENPSGNVRLDSWAFLFSTVTRPPTGALALELVIIEAKWRQDVPYMVSAGRIQSLLTCNVTRPFSTSPNPWAGSRSIE